MELIPVTVMQINELMHLLMYTLINNTFINSLICIKYLHYLYIIIYSLEMRKLKH